MRFEQLYLWYLGDPAVPLWVGTLHLVAAGKGVGLQYSASWLADGFALSEDLPLIDTVHLPPGRLEADGARAAGAVDDARPDRWGEKVIRFVDKPKRLSLMEYLYFAGDDRFGALGVSTAATEYTPRSGGPLPQLAQAQQLSEVVAKVEAAEPINALEAGIVRAGGSLGGAKPKALISIAGEPWVIKFFAGEPVDTPRVEHATLTLAAKAGIRVAQTHVIALATGNALAVRRFDRIGAVQHGADRLGVDRIAAHRIHAISAGTAIRAATASGTAPELGYPELARLLRRRGETHDDRHQHEARELFRRMVFNILIDNTDDHEKNHALLVIEPFDGGHLRLAPAYDMLPSNSGQGFQEFICGAEGRDSTLDNAMSQCEAFGLLPAQAAAEVMMVIKVINTWQPHFAAAQVSDADITLLAERIDGEPLFSQRNTFDPTRYSQPKVRPKRSSPFRP